MVIKHTKSESTKRSFLTLDDVEVTGKTVLVRMDLNVPMVAGKVTDKTRIIRLIPTLKELVQKKARVVILSHLGRPDGKFDPALSLAPLVDELSVVMGGKVPVKFGVDSVGPAVHEAIKQLKAGEILLLENLRYHPEEEANKPSFAKALAALGDIYINDAFSCAHRAHASTEGVAKLLPSAAGRLMQLELDMLESLFGDSKRPLAAVVGGSKISSKLALLENLTSKVDFLIVGGAMANTFLLAQGHSVGTSLVEKNLISTAKRILLNAEKNGCVIVLPEDVIVSEQLKAQSNCRVVTVNHVPENGMILDIGPLSVMSVMRVLEQTRTLVWNGPLGAFETSPFDVGTASIARMVAGLTSAKKLKSVAGGGDTVAALSHAGLADAFSYLSTAGGAFLEWMEGKPLPGVVALQQKRS
jgi:phosphoglycerate kinase